MTARRCPICAQSLPWTPGPKGRVDRAFAARHVAACRRRLADDRRKAREQTRQGRVVEVELTDDGVFHRTPEGELVAVPCQWFALCDRDAVNVEPHPVLGEVPICERCQAKVHGLSEARR